MMSFGVRKATGWVMGAALLSASLASSTARADESSPTGKGIAGGALLGGELVMAVEALAGVQRPLAYSLGAIGGAIAGGVGGHFVENASGNAKAPSYMLAAGVALLIPATVMAFNAVAYRPPADYQEDRSATGAEPLAEPPATNTVSPMQPGPSTPSSPTPPQGPNAPVPPPTGAGTGSGTPTTQGPVSQASPARYRFRRRAVSGTPMSLSMLEFTGEQLRLGVPAVEVRPVFSMQELRQYGMAQREEVRVPVFQATF